jgi:hypothetical protein
MGITLDYSSGPDLIARILLSGRRVQKTTSEPENDLEKKERATSQGRQPLEAGQRKEADSARACMRGIQTGWHLDFSPVTLILDS